MHNDINQQRMDMLTNQERSMIEISGFSIVDNIEGCCGHVSEFETIVIKYDNCFVEDVDVTDRLLTLILNLRDNTKLIDDGVLTIVDR